MFPGATPSSARCKNLANRRLIKTGAGAMAKPAKIVIEPGKPIDPAVVLTLNSFMENVTRKLNGFLSLGDASQSSHSGNIFGQYVEFKTPSADVQFQVDHGLGKPVVARIIVRQDKAGHLYDSNLGGWGPRSVYLKCDVASVLMKVLLLADPTTT